MLQVRKTVISTLVLTVVLSGSVFAIQRVAPRVNFLEFRGGLAVPQGQYDRILGLDFDFGEENLVEFDAADVYKDGYSFGLTYGQILDKHWLVSIGFDYTRNEVKDPISKQIGDTIYEIDFNETMIASQYDIAVRCDYALANPVRHVLSPFVGVSGSAGWTAMSVDAPNYESEMKFDFGLNLDFGLDFKVWADIDSKRFLTLSSINTWNLVSSDVRVSNLQIGGGLRYFFRP